MSEKIEAILTERVKDITDLEKTLHTVEQELQLNPKFKAFLDLQKSVNQQASDMWKYVEEKMIENDIKQLKGDFGTITIAERQGWEIDEEQLPSKFFKKVVDTTKITKYYRLEGKAPKGTVSKITKYLTKRLKG